ncbi:MAG: hypothetical protein KKE50_03715 [Nanoarchaeota archaeon]|nr:hypothetical protein [Nanoarchaeota archaeon]
MEKTKEIIGFVSVIILILLIGNVSAEYVRICLTNGQSISITPSTHSSRSPDGRLICGSGKCTANLRSGKGFVDICVQKVGDNLYYPPSLPSKCSGGCTLLGDNGGEVPSLTLSALWPFSNGGVFTRTSFFLDITTNRIASIKLIDNVAGTTRVLCPNCNSYKRSYTFKQGLNDFTVLAVDGLNVQEKRVTFFIDNKVPRISKTAPSSNSFIGSVFTVYYDEDNLREILLHYGVVGNYKQRAMENCDSGLGQECSVDVSLNEFDNQKIEYWFTIEDIAGNSVESRHVFVNVDETAPVINSFDKNIDGKYATFRIDLTEQNLDKVEYIDNLEEKGKLKTLCSSLKNGICEKKVSFKDGQHDVSIQITDKAGNTANINSSFFTDSKKPKITKTLPVSNGYANGLFMVEFAEENPVSLELNYGNRLLGYQSKPANFNECVSDRGKTTCFVSVDLISYHTQTIQYWFTLSDKSGASTESKKLNVKADAVEPIVSSFSHLTGKGYVSFTMSISESNFFKVEYWDNSETRPIWKTICSSLSGGSCIKKVYLRAGEHDLDIRVSDKAGNYAFEKAVFTI